MKYIICYDIKEDRIRSRIVKYLEEHAFRIQFSVFSCKCNSKEIKSKNLEQLKAWVNSRKSNYKDTWKKINEF